MNRSTPDLSLILEHLLSVRKGSLSTAAAVFVSRKDKEREGLRRVGGRDETTKTSIQGVSRSVHLRRSTSPDVVIRQSDLLYYVVLL